MDQTMFVKPKAGIKIRRPDTQQLLSEKGERVPKTTFWARRILDGDVEEVAGQQEQKPATVEEPRAEDRAEQMDVAANEAPRARGRKGEVQS